jgi:hypothetical protein
MIAIRNEFIGAKMKLKNLSKINNYFYVLGYSNLLGYKLLEQDTGYTFNVLKNKLKNKYEKLDELERN